MWLQSAVVLLKQCKNVGFQPLIKNTSKSHVQRWHIQSINGRYVHLVAPIWYDYEGCHGDVYNYALLPSRVVARRPMTNNVAVENSLPARWRLGPRNWRARVMMTFASRWHSTFQLTGYATESNEKHIFAVLCEWLTPLTTFINCWVFLINICCFFL